MKRFSYMIAAGLLLLSSVPAFAQGNGNGNNDNNGNNSSQGGCAQTTTGGGGALSGTTLRHLQGTLFLALPGLLVPEVVSIGHSGDNALLHQQPVRGSTATLTGTLFCFPPIPRLIALT